MRHLRRDGFDAQTASDKTIREHFIAMQAFGGTWLLLRALRIPVSASPQPSRPRGMNGAKMSGRSPICMHIQIVW
jgi:hypothetical protein